MSTISLDGLIGNKCAVGNAHTIELRNSYNGAGDDQFGGAREWPTIWVQVQFQTGENRRALAFMKKLTEMIKQEFAFCPACEASITTTDLDAGYCTNCNAPLSDEWKPERENR